MHYIYIIQSKIANKYYIGCTNNLQLRLRDHNFGYCKSTKKYKPWILITFRSFTNQQDAYNMEKMVKSYKGGNAFKKIINGEVAEWSKAAPC